MNYTHAYQHTHTHTHTAVYSNTYFNIHPDDVQNSFVIIFTSFVILPEILSASFMLSQKGTNTYTHTFYDIILLVSFADFMTSVEKSLRRGRHLCSRAGPGQWASFRFCFVPFEVFHYDIAGEWTFFLFCTKISLAICWRAAVKVFCF